MIDSGSLKKQKLNSDDRTANDPLKVDLSSFRGMT